MILITSLSCAVGAFCPEFWSYSMSRSTILLVTITKLFTGWLLGWEHRAFSFLASVSLLRCSSFKSIVKYVYSPAFATDHPHQIVGMREGLPCLPWISYKVLAAIFIHIPFALGQVTVTGIVIDDFNMFSIFCDCHVIVFVICFPRPF